MDDRLRDLRKHIGAYAVRQLKSGKAVLRCWRGSTPHNWFVETIKRQSRLWHSTGWDRPSSRFFDKIEDSEERIPASLVHREGGQPFLSTFVLKKEFRSSASSSGSAASRSRASSGRGAGAGRARPAGRS